MSKQTPAPQRHPQPPPANPVPAARSQQELDDLLDEALDETFPASDPIELSSSTD